MRKDFGAKPILYPQPVFIIATYDENGRADAMNAAWGGISEEDQISMCLSASHKTTENILRRKAFTVSMGTKSQAAACDFVGLFSFNDFDDKLEKAGWHTEKSEFVDAPLIKELPMAVECELIAYNPDTCILTGRVKNVCADTSVLDENGSIDPDKLQPIVFDGANGVYRVIGDIAGQAFSDGKKLV